MGNGVWVSRHRAAPGFQTGLPTCVSDGFRMSRSSQDNAALIKTAIATDRAPFDPDTITVTAVCPSCDARVIYFFLSVALQGRSH